MDDKSWLQPIATPHEKRPFQVFFNPPPGDNGLWLPRRLKISENTGNTNIARAEWNWASATVWGRHHAAILTSTTSRLPNLGCKRQQSTYTKVVAEKHSIFPGVHLYSYVSCTFQTSPGPTWHIVLLLIQKCLPGSLATDVRLFFEAWYYDDWMTKYRPAVLSSDLESAANPKYPIPAHWALDGDWLEWHAAGSKGLFLERNQKWVLLSLLGVFAVFDIVGMGIDR